MAFVPLSSIVLQLFHIKASGCCLQVVFVSLFSVASAGGRLLMGFIPESRLHSRGTPRTLFLVYSAAMMTLAFVWCAYARLNDLYVLSILIGGGFGAHWSLTPAIVADLFGLRHFGSNYTAVQLSPAFSTYFLASKLVGYVYDKEAAKQGHERGADHTCHGNACFQLSFLVVAAFGVLSTCCAAALHARKKRVYSTLFSYLKQQDASS